MKIWRLITGNLDKYLPEQWPITFVGSSSCWKIQQWKVHLWWMNICILNCLHSTLDSLGRQGLSLGHLRLQILEGYYSASLPDVFFPGYSIPLYSILSMLSFWDHYLNHTALSYSSGGSLLFPYSRKWNEHKKLCVHLETKISRKGTIEITGEIVAKLPKVNVNGNRNRRLGKVLCRAREGQCSDIYWTLHDSWAVFVCTIWIISSEEDPSSFHQQ